MSALDQIRAIYNTLPTIDCKGWCWHSCGPIDMSNAERERTVELGADIPVFTEERSRRWASNERLYCPALTFSAGGSGKVGCSIYADRPLICRIWGLGEDDLSCPYGCEPSRRLNHAEVMALVVETFRIGGHDNTQGVDLDQLDADLQKWLTDPETAPLMQRWMQGDRSVEPALEAAMRRKKR